MYIRIISAILYCTVTIKICEVQSVRARSHRIQRITGLNVTGGPKLHKGRSDRLARYSEFCIHKEIAVWPAGAVRCLPDEVRRRAGAVQRMGGLNDRYLY